APEDVNPLVDLLRELQKNEGARILFDGVEVPLDSRGEKAKTTRPAYNPFAIIETHVINIILLTPSVILRSTNPHKSDPVTHSIHLLPGARNSSNSSTNSNPSSSSTLPTLANPSQNNPASSTTNLATGNPYLDLTEGLPPNTQSLTRILSSSTLLTALILSTLTDPIIIEDYGRIAEKLGECIGGVMKAVKKVRDWDQGLGKWDEAKLVYSGVVVEVAGFVKALLVHVEFAVKVLKPLSGNSRVSQFGGRQTSQGPKQSVTFEENADVMPSAPAVMDALAKSAEKERDKEKDKEKGERDRKRKSMGTRFKERFTAFIDDMDQRRQSYSSLSSDDSSNRSETAPRGSGSNSKTNGANNDNEPHEYHGHSGMKSKQSTGDLNLLRSLSGNSTANAGAGGSGSGSGTVTRKSSDEPPRLPEIARNGHHVLERPPRTKQKDAGDSKSNVLQRPVSQRLRLVNNEDWRVKLPTDEDSDSSHPENNGTADFDDRSKGKTDRWSLMLSEVVIPYQLRAGSSSAFPLDDTPADSLPEDKLNSRSLSASAAIGTTTTTTSGIAQPTPPSSPPTKSAVLKSTTVSTSASPLTDSDDHIPNSTLRRALKASSAARNLFVEEHSGFPTVKRSSSGAFSGGSSDPEPSSGTGTGTMASESGVNGVDGSGGTGSNGSNRAMFFESLRVVGRKGGQKIPTFDSQGRRIGMLDHGRFSSETEGTDTEEEGGQPGNFSNGSISVKGNLLHLNEDGTDVLVMEMVSGRLHIVAGTLEKLLFRLADESIQDMEFVDCLVQMHGFFITSLDLLENLIARYHVSPPEQPAQEEIEYFAKWKRPIQLKVLTVIGRWVKLQFEEFSYNPALRDRLETFLSEVYADGFRTESDRIKRTASTQAFSIAMKSKCTPFPQHLLYPEDDADDEDEDEDHIPLKHFQRRPSRSNSQVALNSLGKKSNYPTHIVTQRNQPSPLSVASGPQTMLQDTSPILLYDAKDVAKYMSVADQNAFASITVYDYLGKLNGSGFESLSTGSSENRTVRGRIDLFAQRANMIRNWVALEICSIKSLKPRRKALEKFIAMAKYCREFNNFHTCLFIVSGLLSPAVQRLKKTWESLSNKDTATLQSLERLLDPSGNMRAYRRAYASARPPSIPFFPVVMKDVTFLNDGNAGTRLSVASPLSVQVTAATPITANAPATLDTLQNGAGEGTVMTTSASTIASTTPGTTDSTIAVTTTTTGTATSTSTTVMPLMASSRTSSQVSISGGSNSAGGASVGTPTVLINFDKYRSISRLLARYTGSAIDPYDFAIPLKPLMRGLPVYNPSSQNGSIGGSTGGVVSGSGIAAGAASVVANAATMIMDGGLTGGGSGGGGGGSSGLGVADLIAGLVESRLAFLVDVNCMEVAWDWAGRVDGEDNLI
ncbi:hypothetical protein HDU76_005344, partial [Blyttiomyces sp. JEL0837]